MPGTVRANGFTAVRMLYKYPVRPAATGAATTILGLGIDGLGWHDPATVTTPGGLGVVTACTTWWWFRHVARPHTTRGLINRRAEINDRTGGVATWLDVAEHAGPTALRRQAPVLRPSTRDLPRWRRRHLNPRHLGVEVARIGWGLPGQRVWSSCEDATLRVAGPRSGKTTALICHGLDAPGALITTSTRLDLAEGVHTARSKRGQVHVFNPAGLSGLASTVRWRVLSGCTDFETACRRADDLIPRSTSTEAERWDTKARLLLGLLLHAAAVSGRSMSDVRRWASGDARSFEEVRDALLAIGSGGRERLDEWREHCATNDKTRTSISNTMANAVAWVSVDRARALGDADPGDPRLVDPVDLIRRGQTLHLIGHEQNTRFAPLIAALVAEIAHTARLLASHQPGGRLDPPVTMLLDEAAIACPVPLDAWTADMGGRGVTLHICVQSLSQLRQRWGDAGASTILANVATLIIYGGSPAANDLRDISTLVGHHTRQLIGTDDTTPSTTAAVLTPAQIRNLGPWQVLVLRRHLPPFLGWTPKVLDRRGWKPVRLSRPLPNGVDRRITTGELQALFTTPSHDPDGVGGGLHGDGEGQEPADVQDVDGPLNGPDTGTDTGDSDGQGLGHGQDNGHGQNTAAPGGFWDAEAADPQEYRNTHPDTPAPRSRPGWSGFWNGGEPR
jgi:hypothetical protein